MLCPLILRTRGLRGAHAGNASIFKCWQNGYLLALSPCAIWMQRHVALWWSRYCEFYFHFVPPSSLRFPGQRHCRAAHSRSQCSVPFPARQRAYFAHWARSRCKPFSPSKISTRCLAVNSLKLLTLYFLKSVAYSLSGSLKFFTTF